MGMGICMVVAIPFYITKAFPFCWYSSREQCVRIYALTLLGKEDELLAFVWGTTTLLLSQHGCRSCFHSWVSINSFCGLGFTPSQTTDWPPSPVSDGSFYYPHSVSPLMHMHGMPVGSGRNWTIICCTPACYI